MKENQLNKSFYLIGWVIIILLVLTFLQHDTTPWLSLKRINILADVQQEPEQPVAKKDSSKKFVTSIAIRKDSCRSGITCIEDFSEDKKALGYFFRALRETRYRSMKVAFFGDSFIEGDILCSSLRDTLQQLYGGNGVGFVPITSEVSSFRTTIQHTFSGWKTYWLVGNKNPFSPPGFAGYCFVPEEGNEVEYKPGRKRYGNFHSLKIFYKAQRPADLHYTLNDSTSFTQPMAVSDTLHQEVLSCEGSQFVKLRFEPFDSLKLYGVSFEENTGIYIDNFGMRGNSGIGLYQIDPRQIQEFNNFQHYKLVLLQYGLNVVTEADSTGYDWYIDKMVRVISRLKENLPGSNFLLISVSDRSYNQNGKFVTMPNIILMRDAQREIARRSKIAFWDLLTVMSGENSMVKLVTANPPLAAKDYTHVNFAGGRRLAKKLAEALLNERTKYDPKKKILP